MRKLIIYAAMSLLMLGNLQAVAAPQRYAASSTDYRMPMLELYTSEGCSSCPAAENWLSGLKGVGYIIPLAFHVTYWNGGGWRDPFSNMRYDDRQLAIERHNKLHTVYTPQFVFDGKNLPGGSDFHQLIRKTNQQAPQVDLHISALVNPDGASVTMKLDRKKVPAKVVELYLALYENNLVSHVTGGENEGSVLKHDFVVRRLYGPFTYDELDKHGVIEQDVSFKKSWKRTDLNLVLFAENSQTGEVLQVVKLVLSHK